MTELLLPPALVIATLLCALVAGFLFAFAVVVMPGLGALDDAGFLRAFQVVDRVIQNSQPIFMLVWVGSIGAVIVTVALGVGAFAGVDRLLLIAAAAVYLFGVQAPTVTINIPLNNDVQRLDVATMTDAARREARATFEPRWNRANAIRTVAACAATALWLILLLRG